MIGVDLVAIDRVARSIDRFGERFLRRFLSPEEMAMARSAQSVAGFWAAKEAVAKALGTGIGRELSFHDIRLYKDTRGAPRFTLPPSIVQRHGIVATSLSIAHDGGFAIAIAALQTNHQWLQTRDG